jgi:Ca2+-binding RTX toxin-like protein
VRDLLASISYSSSTQRITIDGSGGDDFVRVSFVSDESLQVLLETPTESRKEFFAREAVSSILFRGNAGDDEFENLTTRMSVAYGGTGNDQLFGGSNDDELYGEEGQDRLEGGGGDDLLVGGDGDDELRGGDEDDRLIGEWGHDRMYGGEGNDRLEGGDGEDRLYGDGGDDLVIGGRGIDRIFGGAGDDELRGGDQDDRLYGNDGHDRLFGDSGFDYLYGEAGDDRLYGGSGDDRLAGGSGADELYGEEGRDTVYGEDGDDRLVGDDGDDRLYGGGGVDRIEGGRGNDRMYGGSDNDFLSGDAGEDRLYGEDGDDTLDGGSEDDKGYGGQGRDRIDGGTGRDRLYGEQGDDRIDAGPDDDTVYGGDGDDLLELGPGNDKGYGGPGEDWIRGSEGVDELRGETGHDILHGGSGADVLRGSDQRDLLIGGPDADLMGGDNDDDILIGGTTSYDDDEAKLRAVLTLWRASETYEQRIMMLEDVTRATWLRSGYTVHDDLAVDQLFGDGDRDWYFLTGVLPGVLHLVPELPSDHHEHGSTPHATGSQGPDPQGMAGGHDHSTGIWTIPPDATRLPETATVFTVTQNLDQLTLESGEELHTLLPHAQYRAELRAHAGMLGLVDLRKVTHRAVASGAWSDSATWQDGQIPAEGANVQIPAEITVTVDEAFSDRLKTMRVDGTLRFSPTHDSELRVDTMVVLPTGTLHMGTAAEPIAGEVTARLVFADSGPIDRVWDPLELSRGLIMHGSWELHGEERTSHVPLAVAPSADESVLRLATVPKNWRVGDTIVVNGTDENREDHEVREILAIDLQARTITIAPLRFTHGVPQDGLQVHVAHLTRNVELTSESSLIRRRGHVMVMHTDQAELQYGQFVRLGRTNKLLELNDAVINADGSLKTGTGTNPRGRYPLHFHRTGVVNDGSPAVTRGIVYRDSPGWGMSVHSSFVDVLDSVAFQTAGAGFVTEAGDEIGTFRNNISIFSIGSGESITNRSSLQDFAHEGVGFWFQGSGVVVEQNIASGHAGRGFLFYHRGLEEADLGKQREFLSANLSIPAIANGRTTVPVSDVPIRNFRNNIAYDNFEGINLRYHLQVATHQERGVIDGLLLWNNRTGIRVYYSKQLDLKNVQVLRASNSLNGFGIAHHESSYDLRYEQVRVEGYFVGIVAPRYGDIQFVGGLLRNARNVQIDSAIGQRNLLLDNVLFATVPNFNTSVHIDLVGAFSSSSLTTLAQDRIILNGGRYNNARLYYYQQSGSVIPFPQTASGIPPEYFGLTNTQLWERYGVATGGAVAYGPDGRFIDLILGFVDN